jgi:putative CocE/NonD family hydrolase
MRPVRPRPPGETLRASTLPLAALLTATALAGCITTSEPLADTGLPLGGAFDTSRGWSTPLTPALYELLEGVKEMVPSFDETPIALGIFRPDIAGCEWDASDLPEQCRLPTVMDAGPYYGDRIALDKYRPPTIEWLVPRGYTVIQMSLRGTGESGGCMEYKSLKDVDDVSAVIDWIAAQPWSNGNVGMIGRSYDGTAAWSGAASGNPALKAILPISGAVDAPGMYFKNGTAEGRMLAPHIPIYWTNYGLGLTDRSDPASRMDNWPDNLCPEVFESQVQGDRSSLTGDASDSYWQDRNLQPRILEHYRGAVWVVHGLQDWNVNPSQVVPFLREMQDAGIPTKGWLGVWGHAYPDRVDEHRNVRWDWGQRVLEFFDFYLKGQGPAPRMDVEVEDSLFVWRSEETYPPRDAALQGWDLAGDMALAPEGEGAAGSFLLAGSDPTAFATDAAWVAGLPRAGAGAPTLGTVGSRPTFTSEPLEQAVRIAGLPQLQLRAAPSTPVGGNVFAELFDVYPDGRSVFLSWAALNLRYHAGGNTQPAQLTPGEAVDAMLQFEPLDALLARGHRLRLVVHQEGVMDVLPSPSPEPVELHLGAGASVLRLPVVERPTIVPTYAAPGLAG